MQHVVPKRFFASGGEFKPSRKGTGGAFQVQNGRKPKWKLELRVALGQKQGRVSVGEEPVAVVDRVGVDGFDPLLPHQGGHQHHQGGFGQMKVGHQRVRDAEFVTRIDKDVGFALPCCDLATMGGALDQPQSRGANRDHPTIGGFGGGNLGGG